jgi:hypothetical protein
MRGFLNKVTMVGFLIVTQDLVILCWDLHNYKSCDKIGNIPPRKTPMRQIVKSPKGKKKERGEASQEKYIMVEDPLEV